MNPNKEIEGKLRGAAVRGVDIRTSFNVPASVSRVSGVSSASYNDEQGVFVQAQVRVCGRDAPRLLLYLPLRHPAGRHVGNLHLDMMSLKKPDSAFYYRGMTAGVPECIVH